MAARVHVEGAAVDRLADLGLSTEILERVVRRADAEASTCTALDPPILTGLLRWGRGTRFLREELVPLGWRFDNPRNLPRTIEPNGTFAIVVTSGDESTGLVDFTPTTKYPKGFATIEAVETNEQLALDFGEVASPQTPLDVDPRDRLTWLMLFHIEPDGFRVELSLPDAIVEGWITSWEERIILPR